MATAVSNRFDRWLASLPYRTSAISVLVGLAVLVGWAADLPSLKSVLPGLVSMKANTALAFVLLGLSVWLLQSNEGKTAVKTRSRIALGCALAALVITGLTLLEYASGWDIGIDQMLFQEPAGAVATSSPGRMAISTALTFCFIGVALLVGGSTLRGHHWAAQCLAISAIFSGLLNAVVYSYGVGPLGFFNTTPMAVHTAVLFLVLGAGVLFMHPQEGLMAVFTSEAPGGVMARRLIPTAVAVLIVAGWLRLVGQGAGLYSVELGAAIVVFVAIVATTVAILWSAASLNRSDVERKRAEEELRESEERFSTVFQASHTAIAIATLEGSYLDVNESMLRLTGFTKEEMIGHSSLDLGLIDPDMRERLIQQLRREGSIRDVELKIRDKHGNTHVILNSNQLIQLGREKRFLSMFHDITERKRAEAERDRLFNYSLDMLCIAGFDGYFKQLNPAWEKALGWTSEELMSKPYLDFVHPEDRQPTIDAAGGLAEGKTVITFENRYRCKDGSYKWISWNSYPLMEEKLIFADARDITDHKQAEEIRSRLSAIVEFSEDAIFSKTLDGIIVTWNRGAERMYGYAAEEAIGKHISILASKDHIDEIPEILQRVKAGEAIPYFETIRLRKDRTPVHVSLSMSPTRDASGEITGVSTIARDITERKNAEGLIARQAKELARSNAELEQFAYVASHDLQEPLRMVASYTELIARRYKDKLDAEADEFISYAVDGANRMRALINDLLVYSRVGSRGKEFAPTSLHAVLDEALSNLQMAIQESGAEITHNAMPTVMADGSQLVLVYQNLIGNAIKFRRGSPPRVHLAAERRGDMWVLSVRDNGIGIDPKYFHRLFTMFQRLHARNEYPGTGIGLAIVKKIVERHLGRVWVESEPGKGSTFYFTIPAKEV